MTPTMALRFVKRQMTTNLDANGDFVDFARTIEVRVLQQKFVSDDGLNYDVWQDVPLDTGY